MLNWINRRPSGRRAPVRSRRPALEPVEARRLMAASLYAVGSARGDDSSNLYRIDNHAGSPRAVNLGETGVRLTDLAIHPGTRVGYAVSISNLRPSQLYRVNLANGAATRIGDTGVTSFSGLEFAPDGTLYATRANNNNLYRININTGASTLLFNVGIGGEDLAYDHFNDVLYVTDGSRLARVDPAARTSTRVGSHGVNHLVGLEFDEAGQLYASRGGPYSSFTPSMYRVSKTTGAATQIAAISGVTNFGNYGLALDTGPTVRINDVRVTEGNSGSVPATFTASLSIASTRGLSVNYATANNTARAPGDYASARSTLTFSPGQVSRTLSIAVRGDAAREALETFYVDLSGATGNSLLKRRRGVGTIVDND